MTVLERLLAYFKPNDFKGDDYGWLTNQMGHYLGSFKASAILFGAVCVGKLLLNTFTSYTMSTVNPLNISISVSIFWVLWETYHYIISKNVTDMLEDLFFEFGGTWFFFLVTYLIPAGDRYLLVLGSIPFVGITIWRYIKRA